MRPRQIFKISIDVLMTVALLFQMTYELIGQATHEWQSVWIFTLFILHHILNWSWVRALFKGRYSAYRVLQTMLVALIFLCVMGSMTTGIVLSRHVFKFLPIRAGKNLARNIHMLCAYWGFTLMSIHLGLHWGMMIRSFQRMMKPKAPSGKRTITLRVIAFMIACYGCYALSKRSLLDYMFFRTRFVFFDFREPLIFFMLDYLAMMALFVLIGYYLSQGAKRIKGKASAESSW